MQEKLVIYKKREPLFINPTISPFSNHEINTKWEIYSVFIFNQ